ncbi:uncharacterized protein LOC119353275 [Triticum dicoccoides]|uniref:uncharacterized protein LOC119353275 n=1 Tax=Triticum dicoccoides TaxID=85692 RepID=UPI000844A59B|nr:uncharacterized protein LOC119353275 [Triticum dicoccoides]XP_044455281.1 uncharacterized protein LOC123187474 [Triticum aestivum]
MYRSYDLDFEFMNTMMSYEALGHRLQWTKKLMLPVPMMESWSLYVVDVKERTLLVMDPCETSEPIEEMQYKHEDNANFILAGLRRCIHENITGWYVPAQGWTINYNVGMHESCEIEDSWLHIINYSREYTGLYLQTQLTPGRLNYLRQSIAYEVISMRGNVGELPDFMVEEVLPF